MDSLAQNGTPQGRDRIHELQTDEMLRSARVYILDEAVGKGLAGDVGMHLSIEKTKMLMCSLDLGSYPLNRL